MFKEFQDKVLLITGCNQGIGLGMAKKYMKLGSKVILNDIKFQDKEKIFEELKGNRHEPFFLECDVSDEKSVEEMFRTISERYERFDYLINNAGITRDGMSHKMDYENFKKVLDVNLGSTFLCSKLAYNLMKENQTKGAIVNLSSVVAFKGNIGQANYVASKAAIYGMTKTLALEYARNNVRINCIAPGFIETPMTETIPSDIKVQKISTIPLKRIGTPEDIVNASLFLLSDLSSYITGQVLHVNGGSYL